MAQIMNEAQRLATLESFNPKEHLIAVGKDRQGKQVLYLPAAWRLYELNLRYPNANFKSEIIYHDEERGTVVVKAYLYLGSSYEDSDKKAEAMKQGTISTLDKVETAAKARCARDFGISTEYALDIESDETDARHDTLPVETRHNGQDTEHRAEAPVAQQSHKIEAQPQSGATGKATAQQLSAIAAMGKQLGQAVQMMPDASFEDAGNYIVELQAKLKEARKLQAGGGR